MANPLQFWLMRGVDRVRFPVNPESLSIRSPFGYEDVTVSRAGEVTVIGDRLPKEFTFSSFFPREYNPTYCEYSNIPKPWDAIETLERLRDNRKPIRFTVTGTPISYRVLIRDLDIEPERAGSPGDIYFTISLKVYTDVTIRKVGETKNSTTTTKAKRPSSKSPAPKTYTVKSGDSLWKIAAKPSIYNNGARWATIYNHPKNKALIGKNPDLIRPGQKLVIP
ncbi:LysM peptidoglycan-binding domain-containing protein [Cytobacillus gottheilii]|uniref:LysM peptidoglycan-binding domain-containing protein n=1 Tax=Cytobacillus gottheilii TaxID=859144 RepID=A0ABX8FG36_9BACI|nr:LysM peptidoglycan-binding domain-containing protein [Cytobacillus gottheilii]QVY62991.1 LysM peptidoglycan-binding domain-containing protein [Cytobacillus gottheilii]